ncbi:2-C-methyl-D-erythritol 2,4-cyclodiphosphate synthase [Alkalispirillum mobile]|uniref:2-C-methyl-D-erythritol 2,4-cyclodiphosphate synthase n=1 Tax=Alkalispirillum mobile TaxID=85925 RepID=A0A498C6K4_9GAMM|nr:2-C-methyl-D-erythritol 2,4-cyclodiphosphate synthase [Alkalispirillum mobile]RLK50699.1 2-C-methyl-D-erythritol 2,4-cyclodiphosphate synthase [Alkalispirillum mobile]
MIRVGQGVDAHRFGEPGTPLILGGVQVPHERGLAAHSDGDVLMHAVTDALLGAAGEGDLGKHFPDSDPAYKGIDSRVLLRDALERVQAGGWRVINADATLIAQRPRMAPYVEAMRDRVAADLGVAPAAVNVKATTTEKMGFTGRGEGIAATAVVLIAREGFFER